MTRLLACLFVLLATPAWAEDVPTEGRVSDVVVFPDRARVTRSATVKLSTGAHQIIVTGLPGGVDVGTLRVRGQGTAKVVLGSLDARRDYRPEAADARVRKLQEQLEGLQDADKVLADDAEAAQQNVNRLSQISAKATAQTSEASLSAPSDQAPQAASMLDALDARFRAAKGELRKVAVQRRDLQRQIDALNQELRQARAGGDRQTIAVAVAVDVQKSGSLTVHLDYVIGGAGWSPTYDARADVVADSVELTYGAWVQQASGEDWTDVALKLSTARPALGISAPDLDPWVLRRENLYRTEDRRSRAPSSRAGGMAKMESAAEYDAPAPVMEELYEAEELQAEAQSTGTSVEFAVPGSVSVPGDRTRKRVTIARWSVPDVQWQSRVVPARSTVAYLSADVTNTQDFPLLPGEVLAFAGDSYVGKSSLGQVAPGDKLTLAFGADERLKVERTLVEKTEGKKGLFSGKDSLVYRYRTTVKSLHKTRVDVLVIDRIPVSENDKTVVRLLDTTTPTTDEEDRGILHWTLPLKAGAEAEILLEFQVAWPPDERPINL